MTTEYETRISLFQKSIKTDELIIVSHPHDIFYLTGYWPLSPEERETYLCISAQQASFIHTHFTQCPLVPGLQSKEIHQLAQWKTVAHAIARQESLATVSGDLHNLTAKEFLEFQSTGQFTLTAWDKKQFWAQRQIKSPQEIQAMQLSASIAQRAMEHAFNSLEIGIREAEISNLITTFFLQNDSSCAFPPIVAFAEHSAVPHHSSSDKKLVNNTPVLIDLGARHKGYCSDMTRTQWFGPEVHPDFEKLHSTVLQAYKEGEKIITTPGSNTSAVDTAVRSVFRKDDQEQLFIHTSGHGLGISVHEPPSLHQSHSAPLQPNMIVTLEPGLYYPGKWGYRHENSFLITENGAEVITE